MMLKLIFEERKTLKLSNDPQAKLTRWKILRTSTERPSLSPAIYIIISVASSSSQGCQSPHHQGAKLRELLQKDPFLLTVADPYSGYTAVHWAAKVL